MLTRPQPAPLYGPALLLVLAAYSGGGGAAPAEKTEGMTLITSGGSGRTSTTTTAPPKQGSTDNTNKDNTNTDNTDTDNTDQDNTDTTPNPTPTPPPTPSPSPQPSSPPPEYHDAVFTSTLPHLRLAENLDGSSTAIVLATIAARDDDGDVLTWRLPDDLLSDWQIASSSGQLSYIGTGVNYEQTQTIALTVIVRSDGQDGTPIDVTQ